MTTFQAVVVGVFDALGTFLPLGGDAHLLVAQSLVDWEAPPSSLRFALGLGEALALVVYLRHDIASILATSLQLLLARRKPMTLDERMFFFVGLSFVPYWLSSVYLEQYSAHWDVWEMAGAIAGFGLLLWLVNRLNRQLKNFVDWNWKDASCLGLLQASAVIPGWDAMTALLGGAFALNYRRVSALQFVYLALIPTLILKLIHLRAHWCPPGLSSPEALSGLSFGVGASVAFVASLTAIGGLTRAFQRQGVGRVVLYRILLSLGAVGVHWYRQSPR